ncbi:MAG: OmpW family outer membrane protein [Burkholderiaceae bacterium]
MKTARLAVAAALGLASFAACAQQNTIKLGVAHISIHSRADNLSSNGPAFLTPQPAGISVGDATTLLVSYVRKLDDHWDLDLEAGWPPTHNTYGVGTLAPFGVISKVKQAGPTLFINYNFGAPENRFRPFVGLGINYTRFYDGESTASGQLASGGPTKIELSDSWGPAAQVGASYKLADNWSVIGTIAVAQVKSDLTATTGSIRRTTTIDFRPVVYTLAIGYSF